MPSMVYKWRGGTRLPVDAQQAGEEIEHLRKRANGQLTPAQVVDAARDERNVLHPAFEWDDSAAASHYREDQARYLVAALVTVVAPKGKQREVRAFVSVQKDDQQGYTALHTALSDADLRRQVIARAWAELQAWRQRYESYCELADLFTAIDSESERVKALGWS